MNKYDEIRNLIATSDAVDFADYGDGVSDAWIARAEERLVFTLPASYKWWLRHYGGGEIHGEEIFSIYEQDFDTVVGGDIVYHYELNKLDAQYGEMMAVICETDDDVFYFDILKRTRDGELPVYSLHDGEEEYARDFIDFLKKRIVVQVE